MTNYIYQSNNRGTNNNKVVLYDTNGKIFSPGFLFRPNNGNLVNLVLRDQSAGNNLKIKNLEGSDSEIVLTTTNQSIGGSKTFTSQVVCTQNPINNNHLIRKSYVDSQISNADYINYLKLD